MSNIYVIIISIYLVWLLFFDMNSWLTHRELNQQQEKLQEQKQHLEKEIARDKAEIKKLEDPKEMERFAREEYHMKKEGEEIFLIEYEDSIKNQKNE